MNQKNNLQEAWAISQNGQDVHAQAMIKIQQMLNKFKMFPFFQSVERMLRDAVDETAGYFQNEPQTHEEVPEQIQLNWLSMVGDFVQSMSLLGMIAATYSASRKDPSGVQTLKDKAAARFLSSTSVPKLKKQFEELKAAGVDVQKYEQVLDQAPQKIIDGAFSLDANKLATFSDALTVSPELKNKLADAIQKNKQYLTPSSGMASNKTLVGGLGSDKPSTIPPQVAQQIAVGFKQYMEKLKKDYGNSSLELLQKTIQDYITANAASQ